MATAAKKTTVKKDEKSSSANARYTRAQTRLREAHKEEFEAILAEVYAEEGDTYKRRRTAAERAADKQAADLAKARETIAALVEKHGNAVIDNQRLASVS